MIFRRLSALAAEGLGAIISKDGEVLSRKCHATVRMLYAQVSVRHVRDACRFDTVRASQKVFCVSFPLLVEHVKAAASADVGTDTGLIFAELHLSLPLLAELRVFAARHRIHVPARAEFGAGTRGENPPHAPVFKSRGRKKTP